MELSKKALTLFALAAAYAGYEREANAQEVSSDLPPGQAQPARQAGSAAYQQVSDPVMVGTAAAQQPVVWGVVTDEAQAVCGPYYSITTPCTDLAQIQRARSEMQEGGLVYHAGTRMVTNNGQVDYSNSFDFIDVTGMNHGGVRDERRITAEIVGVSGITDNTEVEYAPDEYRATEFRSWEFQSIVDAVEGAVGFQLTNEQIRDSILLPNMHSGEGIPSPNDVVIFRTSSIADNSREIRISSAPNAGSDVYDVMVRCHNRRCTGENGLPLGHWDDDGQIIYLPDGTFLVHPEIEGLDRPIQLRDPATGEMREYRDGVFVVRMDAYFPQASHTAVVAPGQVPGVEYVQPEGQGRVIVVQRENSQQLPQCSDGLDNDLDTLVDRGDPGCENGFDNDEYNAAPVLPQCSDRLDNDGDGLFDAGDPGCANGFDNDEYNPVSGPVCPPAVEGQCPPCEQTQCPPAPGCPPATECPAVPDCPTCPEPTTTGNGPEVTPNNGGAVPPSNVDVRPVIPPEAQPEESFFNPKVMLGARVAYIFNENLHNVAADYVLPMLIVGGNIPGSNWNMYGALGFGYAGESSVVDPRSRTTEPNPEDPLGLTSRVSGATETDDFVASAGIGAIYRMDWFQLDMSAGALAVVRDRDSYRDEYLLFPNGEIADEQHFTDSDVDPVFAGYVSGGLGLRADPFSFDLGGMLIVDKDGNVSGGPYAGFAVYFGGSEDPEDEQ